MRWLLFDKDADGRLEKLASNQAVNRRIRETERRRQRAVDCVAIDTEARVRRQPVWNNIGVRLPVLREQAATDRTPGLKQRRHEPRSPARVSAAPLPAPLRQQGCRAAAHQCPIR